LGGPEPCASVTGRPPSPGPVSPQHPPRSLLGASPASLCSHPTESDPERWPLHAQSWPVLAGERSGRPRERRRRPRGRKSRARGRKPRSRVHDPRSRVRDHRARVRGSRSRVRSLRPLQWSRHLTGWSRDLACGTVLVRLCGPEWPIRKVFPPVRLNRRCEATDGVCRGGGRGTLPVCAGGESSGEVWWWRRCCSSGW
jgi:hypothetical protein